MWFSHKAVAGKSYVKYYAQCFELSTALKTFQIYQNRRLTVQPHKYFILHSYYMNYLLTIFWNFKGHFFSNVELPCYKEVFRWLLLAKRWNSQASNGDMVNLFTPIYFINVFVSINCVLILLLLLNRSMPGGNKNVTHTQTVAFSCRFV